MEMRTYLGEDEGKDEVQDEHSPGGIATETLGNMRTVASLSLESSRADEFDRALREEEKHPIRENFIKGTATGVGQFLQFWGFALMFWWGSWLLTNYPETYSYRSYLISMFSLFFSMYGMTTAAQGAVNREKAKAAGKRIFELTDRKSQIDPLSDDGMKDVLLFSVV
jgi:ATP-binding cassette subfamily B (MDR/TAP) protein 1